LKLSDFGFELRDKMFQMFHISSDTNLVDPTIEFLQSLHYMHYIMSLKVGGKLTLV